MKGLPENADRANVRLALGSAKLEIEYMGKPDQEGCLQMNASVPGDVEKGMQCFTIQCASTISEPWMLRIV